MPALCLRCGCTSVVAVAQVDNDGLASGLACCHKRKFIGLRARIGERNPVYALWRLGYQGFGQLHVMLVQIQRADVLDFIICQHLGQFLLDFWVVVTGRNADDATDAVQVFLTFRVPYMHALGLFQVQGLVVIKRQRQEMLIA